MLLQLKWKAVNEENIEKEITYVRLLVAKSYGNNQYIFS